MTDLTQKYLKECIEYNPETGLITWRNRPLHHFKDAIRKKSWNNKHAGKKAGCVYTYKLYTFSYIRINKKLYTASRVIWLYMTGDWPEHHIDHIDRDSTNNRWENLRDVPQSINLKNKTKYKNNTSGYTGIRETKNGRYIANYLDEDKRRYRTFDDLQSAIEFRRKGIREVGGYTIDHGGLSHD